MSDNADKDPRAQAVIKAATKKIEDFDKWFQEELKNSPLAKSEVALLKSYLWWEGIVRTPIDGVGRVKSLELICRSIDVESVQPGQPHPAERMVLRYLEDFGEEGLLQTCKDLHPIAAISFMRLMGRMFGLSSELRSGLVQHAIQYNVSPVLSAAADAVELWGDARLASILDDARESSMCALLRQKGKT